MLFHVLSGSIPSQTLPESLNAQFSWMQVGVFCTVPIAVLQILMHKFKIGADSYNAYQIRFAVEESADFSAILQAKLNKLH